MAYLPYFFFILQVTLFLDTHDSRFPSIGIFAIKDIPPGHEVRPRSCYFLFHYKNVFLNQKRNFSFNFVIDLFKKRSGPL